MVMILFIRETLKKHLTCLGNRQQILSQFKLHSAMIWKEFQTDATCILKPFALNTISLSFWAILKQNKKCYSSNIQKPILFRLDLSMLHTKRKLISQPAYVKHNSHTESFILPAFLNCMIFNLFVYVIDHLK